MTRSVPGARENPMASENDIRPLRYQGAGIGAGLIGRERLAPRRVIAMTVNPLPTTSVTLLTRLRQDPSDQAGWDEFVECYGRHIYRWCRQWKLQDADAEDVTQDILEKLTQTLRAFAYDPSRSFRCWLKTVAHHTWRDFEDSRRQAQAAAGDSQVQELMLTVEAPE